MFDWTADITGTGDPSIPFINNGRTRRPLTPIKYIENT